jgi:prepilin-type N-terminal cleavage/methylation domain-containing protein/prepilin-type processing-associated H-X9-DG protein
MPWTPICQRRAFSLIELLVVVAILGVLMGLTLAAVQKARAAAGRCQCANNLHQIALAAHEAHDSYGFIPGNPYADRVIGTTFYHLLPYVEQQAVHEAHTYNAVISVFRCSNDPSSSGGANAPGNYATNELLFVPGARVELATSMPDGTSCTIMFAEKYAACSNWASVADGTPIGCFKPAYTASAAGLPGGPFQVLPGVNAGDPALPQSAHAGGIQVAMGDGSVRFIHAGISNALWYSANAPDDGQGLPDN